MAKQKYYVVWKGKVPGVYDTWAECQAQIKEVKGALYRSFDTRVAAQQAIKRKYSDYLDASSVKSTSAGFSSSIITPSLSVDAACSGNPGLMEYRGVDTATKREIFKMGPYKEGTNNIGEFLALVHGLALLKQQNSTIPIYTDSVTALSWVKNKKVKTTLEETPHNAILFELVERALAWLHANTYTTKILKWETAHWGEIPADFGRK